MTDPIAAAIAHIRRITPSNDPWTAKDIAFESEAPDEIDDSIATILNAVVAGQLILADALEAERAKVAEAYRAAACVTVDMGPRYDGRSVHYHIPERVKGAIRALTPADAKAALSKMLAQARLEGWRAGREAAAKATFSLATNPHCGSAESRRDLAETIRALPEPKEANHDD